MKNILGIFAAFSLLAGGWISVYGMMVSSLNNGGEGVAIAGAVIFGASLVSLAILRNPKR